MSWIKEISRQDSKEIDVIYSKAEQRTNKLVANVLKAHSIKPNILKAHINLYEQIMFGKGQLSRSDREMIGVVVSRSNQCPYCVSHHSEALFHNTENQKLMEEIADNYQNADINSKQITMCKYAEKLTKTPYKIVNEDIETLRKCGYTDEEIFEINQVCAYFNYVNRIVHGLGVELE